MLDAVWDSSIVACRYLERHAELVKGRRCLDLSAGCGLAGAPARECQTYVALGESLSTWRSPTVSAATSTQCTFGSCSSLMWLGLCPKLCSTSSSAHHECMTGCLFWDAAAFTPHHSLHRTRALCSAQCAVSHRSLYVTCDAMPILMCFARLIPALLQSSCWSCPASPCLCAALPQRPSPPLYQSAAALITCFLLPPGIPSLLLQR